MHNYTLTTFKVDVNMITAFDERFIFIVLSYNVGAVLLFYDEKYFSQILRSMTRQNCLDVYN